ncbi:MAG: helix-turn-helix domain-containing protein [Pyrinomonadaceae bacterium]
MLTFHVWLYTFVYMDSTHYYHEKLASARNLRAKTQKEIAEMLGVDAKTIHRAETGITVSYQLLTRLCDLYSIPMTTIVKAHPETAPA